MATPQEQLGSLQHVNCSICGVPSACLFSLRPPVSRLVKFRKLGACVPVCARKRDAAQIEPLPEAAPPAFPQSVPAVSPSNLRPMHGLDPSHFQPLSEMDFATLRLGLHRKNAKLAIIQPEKQLAQRGGSRKVASMEALECAWQIALREFDATGANSLQFVSFIEQKFPYEFHLLAQAGVGIERHRLAESCREKLLPADSSMMEQLANRMTARISMAMAGTSTQRERENCEELSQTSLRNKFNGSMMREICILHSMDSKLMIPLQTHLGIAVRAGINQSELVKILLSFQIVPNEEVARKWLLEVEEQANSVRIERACEWAEVGDGWSVRMDNADVGRMLHFVALMATRDHAPPAPPFPFASASATTFNPGTATWSSPPPRSTALRSFQQLSLEQFGLSVIETSAVAGWWQLFDLQVIDAAAAVGGAKLTRADLSRRTKHGLFNSRADGALALGLKLEVEVLGPAPSAPVTPLPPPQLPPPPPPSTSTVSASTVSASTITPSIITRSTITASTVTASSASEVDPSSDAQAAHVYYHYCEADDGTADGDVVENPIIGSLVARSCLNPSGGTYLGLLQAGRLNGGGEREARTVSWHANGSDELSLRFDFIVASCNPKLISWPRGGALFANEEYHHQRVGFFLFSDGLWESVASLFGVSTGKARRVGGDGHSMPPPPPREPPSQPQRDAAASPPETQQKQRRAPLISPPRRMASACCDYTPSPHFPFDGLEVRKGESLSMIGVETPQDLVCLARSARGEGMLPAYVIGQGEMVRPEEREQWEMAMVESARVAPAPNRMKLAHSLLLERGAEAEGAPLNLNRERADHGRWTEQDAARRRVRRDDDDPDDGDYVPTEPLSGSDPGSDCDDNGLDASTGGPTPPHAHATTASWHTRPRPGTHARHACPTLSCLSSFFRWSRYTCRAPQALA